MDTTSYACVPNDASESDSGSESDFSEDSCDACPQSIRGDQVWPSRWGVTREQVRELLHRLRQDSKWRSSNSVYVLVRDFIIPWTTGHGIGYALLVNQELPKEANVMISHAFAENAEDFLETVYRATFEDDIIFICALGIYQAEDGKGPSIADQLGMRPQDSPFQQVLQRIKARRDASRCHWRCRRCLEELPVLSAFVPPVVISLLFIIWRKEMVLFVLDKDVSDQVVQWCISVAVLTCCFNILGPLLACSIRCTSCAYSGRMIVVPNHTMDIYSRLWCVYEIFVASTLGIDVILAPTLASAGEVSSRLASCHSTLDADRIRAAIEDANLDYDDIDRAVKRTMRASFRHTLKIAAKYALLQGLPFCAWDAVMYPFMVAPMLFIKGCGTSFVLLYSIYRIALREQGIIHITWRSFVHCAGLLFSCVPFQWFMHDKDYIRTWWGPPLELVYYDYWWAVFVLMASISKPFPPCFRAKHRIRTLVTLTCFLLFFFEMTAITFCHSVSPTFEIWDFEDWLRVFAGWTSFHTWAAIFPIYTYWTEGLKFGIKVKIEDSNEVLIGRLAMIVLCLSAFAHLTKEYLIPVNENV